ncbi:unnamed protein product, partial [Leptidea sinapis]
MLYKIQAENNHWNVETFGHWTSSYGLFINKEMYTPTSMRRKNLMGAPIKSSVVATEDRTRNEIMSLRNIFQDPVSRVNYRQLGPIHDFMNATRVTLFTKTWGYILNGSYNGMVGDLTTGNADLAGTMIYMNKPRLDVLDFLSYPSPPLTKFVFRQPSLSYQNNLFILPFKPVVWLCIAALSVLLSVLIYINTYWECVKQDKKRKIIIMVISAISQQGTITELKGSLGRSVMFILFFCFVLIYTSYSANIVALLQSKSNQIRTLSDLLNSRLELGAEENVYNRYFFSTAADPVRKAIYERKVKSNFLTLEEGVIRMQTTPFAFHINVGVGYRMVEKHFQEHEKCGLQEIQFIPQNKAWQTCRVNTPYKEIFKIGNQEHGFNDRENRLIYGKKPSCAFTGSSFDSVNMIDFYPVLLLFTYGFILAIMILFLELLYKY